MSILAAKGEQSLNDSSKGGALQTKVDFIKLKSGTSFKVAFLRDNDNHDVIANAEYFVHGDYNAHVFSHPCIRVIGNCPSCDAGVPRSKKYLIAFIDLSDGERRVCEFTRKQFNGIKDAVADYTSDGSVFELAFKLSKTGTKTDTVVNCTPILKPSAHEKDYIATNETPVTDTFFDDAIGEPDADYIRSKIVGYVKSDSSDDSASDPTKQF